MELSKDLIRTRGNNIKLIQHHCHYDLRKFNFTSTFKDRLDKFWSNRDVLYDYKADLHGIGNRSIS